MVKNTQCTIKRNEYDVRRAKGTLGSLEVRPVCDADGFYEPYMCIPEQKYCIKLLFVIYFILILFVCVSM